MSPPADPPVLRQHARRNLLDLLPQGRADWYPNVAY